MFYVSNHPDHQRPHRTLREPGKTILEVATQAGIFIPTLCLLPLVKPEEGCRICVVEVQGAQTDCLLRHPGHEGMVVRDRFGDRS